MARFGPIDRVSGTIGVEQNSPMRTPGVAKRASVVGDGEVAARDELAARRRGDAVHLGDDRLRDRLHGRHQPAAGGEQLGRVVALAGRQLGEVVAGREGRTGPGDDDHPSRGPFEGLLQLPHQLERQRVAPLGPVERDPRDRFDVLHQEVLPRAHPVDRTARVGRSAELRGGEDLAVEDGEPGVGGGGPGAPGGGHVGEVGRGGEAELDGSGAERGGLDAVGPQAAPPRPFVVGGVAPGRRARPRRCRSRRRAPSGAGGCRRRARRRWPRPRRSTSPSQRSSAGTSGYQLMAR